MSEIIFTPGASRGRGTRLARAVAWMLIALGSLALADALVTIVWQEPISALYATIRQGDLEGQLHEIEAAPPPPRERRALERTRDERHRVLLLARRMEARTPRGSAIGRIDIPRIDSSFVLLDGTGTSELEAGPGLYTKAQYGVVFPGVPGTTAIAGHRTTFLEPFKHIAELRRGEHIYITMPYARLSYTITGHRAVLPGDISAVVARKRYTRLVLSSCTPEFSAEQRLLVFARLTRVQPRGAAVIHRHRGRQWRLRRAGGLMPSPTRS
jgi:sortase A